MAEPEQLAVLDASAAVDVLADTARAGLVRQRLSGIGALHVPAHFDAEVLSALARLHRAGYRTFDQVEQACTQLAAMPVTRHPLPDLVGDAWRNQGRIRVSDGLYVALAERLGLLVISTDARLGRSSEWVDCV